MPAPALDLDRLVEDLGSARDRAEAIAGDHPLGVRAVEIVEGRRGYLVALPGPRFLCLDGALATEGSGRRARETARASLLAEYTESALDAALLNALVESVGRALAVGIDPPEVQEALGELAQRAIDVAEWSAAPERALASVPRLDDALALHARLLRAWERYVKVSEPLAEAQDALDDQTLAALRGIEEAAAAAGAARSLTDALAQAMSQCDAAADEILAAHVTRLRDDDL
jgi:nucleotide-binding universal stress UspA family protein